MDSIKKSFGARIKEIREKSGLNQEQLAELVNMESRHISRIETGKSFTTLENLSKIAQALNVDISVFFDFSHKKNKEDLIQEINSYLQDADMKQLELVYRLILSVFK